MEVIMLLLVLLGLGGFLTLFSTCYIGGNPWFVAPLSLLLVVSTWISHDLVQHFGRSSPKVRLVLTWAFTGRMKQRLREFGALITMLQLWTIVSIAPALLSWFLCNTFPQYLHATPFVHCFSSCVFMEALFSLWLDLPSGFVGIVKRVKNDE